VSRTATAVGSPVRAPRTFKIHRCVGRGGFGEVYQATVHGDGPPITAALKVLHADVAPGSEAVERLRDERRMLGALDHPAILRAHELAVLDGRVALVTEYVDGEDLSTCLRAGPLPAPAALRVVQEVAGALLAASLTLGPNGRPLGLVHRDVKPSNIRIARSGGVKLLDFGVARADGIGREAHTASGVVMGSLPYMAPELLTGDSAGAPSDVYALGCTLFEALTGERLFLHREPDLIGLLLNDERFVQVVADRLVVLRDPRLVVWLSAMLAFARDERPGLAEIAAECTGLGASDEGLRSWCLERSWPRPDDLVGPLSGRVIREQLVDPTRVPRTHPSVERAPTWDAHDHAVTMVDDATGTLSRPQAKVAVVAPVAPGAPVGAMEMIGAVLVLVFVGMVVVGAFAASYLVTDLLLR
jgi:serine/threonine protein kinase